MHHYQKFPLPVCVLVTDDPASVVTLPSMPIEPVVPIALLEVATEAFAPGPHFSSKLPIRVSEIVEKQCPAPVG
jgi:hypothetical protein